jgi:hypothetical protein
MSDALDELRESGYIQAFLHYQDGSVYLYTWKRAYLAPHFEECRSEFLDMLRRFIGHARPNAYRGHDDCPILFLMAQSEPCRLEWVSEET